MKKGKKEHAMFLGFFFKKVLTLDLKVDYFACFNPWSSLNHSYETESAFLEGSMVSIAQFCLSVFKKQFKQILSLKGFLRVFFNYFFLVNQQIYRYQNIRLTENVYMYSPSCVSSPQAGVQLQADIKGKVNKYRSIQFQYSKFEMVSSFF